jgi:hypothetical protein
VNLPPSVPCPASGSPIRFGFMVSITTMDPITGGLPWVRRTSSPYRVQLHFGSVRRISGLARPCMLDLLPAAVHGFCLMLPPDAPFLETALALLALPFRPVTAGVL